MTTLYIDESKANGYTVVAAAVLPREARELQKVMRDLRKAGQRRVHFVKESDSRRREILSKLARADAGTRVYHARGMTDADAREACLVRVIADAAIHGVTRIVLERDESIVDFDRRILYRELSSRGLRDRVSYLHDDAVAEPLLCIPDAVAWSFARGGEWTTRARPLILEVVDVR